MSFNNFELDYIILRHSRSTQATVIYGTFSTLLRVEIYLRLDLISLPEDPNTA